MTKANNKILLCQETRKICFWAKLPFQSRYSRNTCYLCCQGAPQNLDDKNKLLVHRVIARKNDSL